nr:alpha-2-macroglobulin receptor-associated protein isoform X1 [Maniola hyperantus]XP_034828669.1 alpha-2-macroglobulin receptor-associated protein isoform X2 [Maniola hyperantus]
MSLHQILRFVIITFLIANVLTENKYSRSANEKKTTEKKKSDVDFRTLEKPFRMNKLNMVWLKAQQRLTEPKLKSLYSDLMIQDKEEITYKRVKSEGGDKEGLREADLRRKLTNIMTNYGLREHFEDASVGRQKQEPAYNEAMEDYINKSLFKDKKLNMLWAKAEASGFTSEELAALREEFTHHQDKIDQYYDLLVNMEAGSKDGYKNAVNDEELDKFNEINLEKDNGENLGKDYLDKANLVREKHRSLRDGYDRLQRIAAKGPTNKEFIEPKVQGLWKMAAAANFTVDELESLKVELKHYESRLLKLRTLHADHVSNFNKHHSKVAAAGDKMDHFADQQQMIKKHSRKVEKMHADLEGRILARHTEL